MNPSFFRLPIDFSETELQSDLLLCEKEVWPEHYNKKDYSGEWRSIALRSASGSSQDITSFPNQAFLDTPLMLQCPYFKKVADWFQCDKEAIRLLRLAPKSEIKEHRDNDTSYEEGFFRIHVPILTNDHVQFVVDKQLVPMRAGSCWYANFQLPHSVRNDGDEPRVHLVIDCIRNEWSDTLFSANGFDVSQKHREFLSDDTRLLVIDELMRSGHPASQLLAEELRKEIRPN